MNPSVFLNPLGYSNTNVSAQWELLRTIQFVSKLSLLPGQSLLWPGALLNNAELTTTDTEARLESLDGTWPESKVACRRFVVRQLRICKVSNWKRMNHSLFAELIHWILYVVKPHVRSNIYNKLYYGKFELWIAIYR